MAEMTSTMGRRILRGAAAIAALLPAGVDGQVKGNPGASGYGTEVIPKRPNGESLKIPTAERESTCNPSPWRSNCRRSSTNRYAGALRSSQSAAGSCAHWLEGRAWRPWTSLREESIS
jgi:hypothetical protein